jgi:hypothetical protein
MSTQQPRIGMDRYIDPSWMAIAAGVTRGENQLEELKRSLAAEITSSAVRAKTVGILNRIWLSNDLPQADLAQRAAAEIGSNPPSAPAIFVATSIASYPYFREVLDNVGRLLRLQESCTSGEVHRRMFEVHGKRSTIDQATSYAIKTMTAWGLITRNAGGRIAPAEPLPLTREASALLSLAANLSRRSISPLGALDPIMFPFFRL